MNMLREPIMTSEPRLRIILLEDELTLHHLLVVLIRGWHPDVDLVAVKNGDDAWRSILRKQPDLLITDEIHPGMFGHAIVRKLAKKRVDCSVLWTSGYLDQDLAEMFVGLKCEILLKPFGIEEFRQTLDRLLPCVSAQ